MSGSEKRQWKNHEYLKRLIKGAGVPGYIYPKGNSNHNTVASEESSSESAEKDKTEEEKTMAEKWLEKSKEIERAKKSKKKSSSSSKSKSSKSSKSKSSSSSKSKGSSDSSKSQSKSESDPEAKMNKVLPSGFEIYESYEEDGDTVFLIDAPNGERHEFVGVPSKEEMNRWANSLKHGEEGAFYIASICDGEYLAHHGILGQKWGIRRYQNPDGSLTPEGKKRYGSNFEKGIPKAKLKKALNDYNLRTGNKVKLKDARTVRVGQFLYDKKGRRIYEDSTVQSDDKKESKKESTGPKDPKKMTYQELNDAVNLARVREQYKQYYGPKPKVKKEAGPVAKFVKNFAGKAVNNISDAALSAGKQWVQDQFNEAFGLNNGPKDAKTMTELLAKDQKQWTFKDWQNASAYTGFSEKYFNYRDTTQQDRYIKDAFRKAQLDAEAEAETRRKALIPAQKAKETAEQKEAARQQKLEEDYVRSWVNKQVKDMDNQSPEKTGFDKIVDEYATEQAYDRLNRDNYSEDEAYKILTGKKR